MNVETSDQLIVALIKETDLVRGRVFGSDRVPTAPGRPYVAFTEAETTTSIKGDGGDFAEYVKTYQIDYVNDHGTPMVRHRPVLLDQFRRSDLNINNRKARIRVREMRRVPAGPGETIVRDAITVVVYLAEEAL